MQEAVALDPLAEDAAAADATPDTAERILAAAEACIRRWGIRRVSMNDVAREAGVSRGSVYRYFHDRDALVQAALEQVAEQRVREAEPAVRAQPTLAAKVAEAAVFVRRLADDEVTLGLHEHPDEPQLATLRLASTETMFERWVDFWIPFLADARDNGEVRSELDLRRASEWIMRMLISLVTVPSVTIDLGDARQVRRFVEDHLVKGFRE